AHFAVKDIVVEGRAQTSRQAIFAALGIDGGAPILGFDPRAAEARLMQLPWVASATVERRLPDGIVVHLIERVPLARWQHDNQTVVIDADGQPLPQASLARFADLPLVVGSGAPEASAGLLQALKDYPAITKMMTAAVRVSGRRWDFHMEPGVVVRMPAGDLLEGLERLATLIAKQGILSHAVTVIDLRLPDRMIFEPSAAAVAAAKATAKAGKANKGPARP
ncbi:MAG TPA: cell division protein FtsQ/DivIB, partial [Alphaproteobacteria bacterium]|nr:cell division protein FtsQ/DivIB [Alphaproteobacteria bacterium]